MAEEPQAGVLSAAFPAPPPFYKHFTPENLARLEEVQDDPSQERQAQSLNLSNLPQELLYQIPPEPPISGLYKSFGETFDISNPLPTLRSRGIERLYPTPPSSPSPQNPTPTTTTSFSRTYELTKLSRSILLNYLDLIGTLSSSPSLAPEKIEDIRILFLNAHHLINEYRPHQARETMIEMVERQIERRRAEIEGVSAMQGRVEAVVRGFAEFDLGVDGVEGMGVRNGEDGREEGKREEVERRRVWDALDEIEV